jgi:hypothetical protein
MHIKPQAQQKPIGKNVSQPVKVNTLSSQVQESTTITNTLAPSNNNNENLVD